MNIFGHGNVICLHSRHKTASLLESVSFCLESVLAEQDFCQTHKWESHEQKRWGDLPTSGLHQRINFLFCVVNLSASTSKTSVPNHNNIIISIKCDIPVIVKVLSVMKVSFLSIHDKTLCYSSTA